MHTAVVFLVTGSVNISPYEKMKCIYINLDKADDRRARFEANWAEHSGRDWQLERFPAIDARYVEEHCVPGQLRPGEKGCFLSHCAAIGMNLDASSPLLILEDDSVLGPRTATTINNFLNVCSGLDWDIVFTEVGILFPSAMIDLFKLRRELEGSGEVRLLDLAGYDFAGSTGYLVNPRSMTKLATLLGGAQELDIPYDIFLRTLVHTKQLKALMFFPFVTSLSHHAGLSDIRDEGAIDRIWIAYRQLVAQDRDLDKVRRDIAQIDADLSDNDTRLLGTLLAGFAAKSFAWK
jgi:GR25 family glycosyltransferase involved in LPS biosynthesis